MKYQTEYQRNYQPRATRKFHEWSAEERKLTEVPRRLSPSRRRGRSVPSSPVRKHQDDNFAVIGPNDKFSQSQLYRMRSPVKDHPRATKSNEYAILGKNDKFENNVTYKLRQPVLSDSPRVVVRRRKKDNHSCGIQTELNRVTSASYDARYKRDHVANRRRLDTQSEYKDKYNWKQPAGSSFDNSRFTEEPPPRERRPATAVPRPERTSVAVNTPARVEIDMNTHRSPAKRVPTAPTKLNGTSEYRRQYKPTNGTKKPKVRKAFEAEYIPERRPREKDHQEHAYTDDEGTGGNVDLGSEFRQKYPHGKLRRWKSEYQSTYKPFWRFDYKDGKWYKDSSTDEKGFNPNLFWYKELMSTRKRADQFRANAETDHFSRDYSLQLQTGYDPKHNYRAWDLEDQDDSSESVISIDRDLEREQIEGERRREKDAQRNEHEQIPARPSYQKYYTKPKTDQTAQTEHQTDRIIYVDDPPPKQPSAATKAFVRNLGSSSVQQHMSWDSESLYTQRTNSDLNHKSTAVKDLHRKQYRHDHSPKKQESRGTRMHSPISSERQYKNLDHNYTSTNHQHNGEYATAVRSPTSHHETTQATGRPSYDSPTVKKRPHTTTHEYCTYPGSRFKDEVTDYYYGGENNKQQHYYTPASKSSFQNQLHTLDRTYPARYKDDDVLSNNSVRSLSSSCNLASQTFERAQQNMNKYWGDQSPSSSKKVSSAKH